MTKATSTRAASTPAADRLRRLGPAVPYLSLAAVAYLPLLLVRRGLVNADTKLYLYLDPGGLLERATSLWDPAVGGGTVTHQTIGYLWPMGPYYWVADLVQLPDWIAQRVWMGSILFAAAAGALHLLNHLLGRHPLNLVGAFAYGFTPYVLGHITGQSALLLPFAALPWLVVFMDRSCTERGWRWPAAYALVVATCGSLNGSSVFFVVLGSALWAPMLLRSSRAVSLRDASGALVRTGGLTLVTQLWWLVAYSVGGRFGLPLLATTETVETTSTTTAAPEVIRGLGYWFFYGSDTTGPWLDNIAPAYMQNPFLIGLGFVIPTVALAAGGLVRWSHRTYFATLSAVGLVIAVGAHDPGDRSPFGGALAGASKASDLVLSLRNTQRATPLLLLGLAGLLTAGVRALALHRPNQARIAGVALCAITLASFPHLWTSGLIADRFHRPDTVPQHWQDAAAHLAADDGRILEIPGIDFGAYRWGHTLDPLTPALVDRSVLARELVPMGSPPGVSLFGSLDRSIQEGTFEPDSLGPVARALGASSVVIRGDLQYERYRTVRPRLLWRSLLPTPAGLDDPVAFGVDMANRASPDQPMLDEVELGIDPFGPEAPAVAVFDVVDPHPLVRAVPTRSGTIISGDGDGVVATAAAGLLERPGPLRLAAEVTIDDERLGRALQDDTLLVITDTNRLRGQRWYSLRDSVGATEPPGQPAIIGDPGDARIPPVPLQADASLTVAEHRGAARVWATSYGNPVTLTPENRAVMAFDRNDRTSWALEDLAAGDRKLIGIELDRPVPAETVRLRQAVGRPGMRPIHSIKIRLDGHRLIEVDLDDRSFGPDGQEVLLDGQPFSRFEITLTGLPPGSGPAGFSRIDIPGVVVEEVLHLPTDLFDAVGDIDRRPLAIVLSRHRVNPAEVVRSDPEVSLTRAVDLPVPLTWGVSGTARLSGATPEPLIDELVGIPSATDGGMTVFSREYLAGNLSHRGSSAFDGDPSTAWRTPFGNQTGAWVEMVNHAPFEIDTLVLDVVADGRHSLPREVLVEVEGNAPRAVELPAVTEHSTPNETTRVEVPLGETLRGERIRLTLSTVDERATRDWYTGDPIALPIGIAGVHIPGAERPPAAPLLDDRCRDDLVTVDHTPLPVRVHGSTAEALAREPLLVEACGEPLELAAGERIIRSSPGARSGIDIDRLVLERGRTVQVAPPTAPQVDWVRHSATAIDAMIVDPPDEPFWLVFSESWNTGWVARAGGVDLGPPEIHDSFGMGWWIEPSTDLEGPIELRWTPQRTVDIALAVSGLAALVCLALLFRPGGRRLPRPAAPRFVTGSEVWSPWWGLVAFAAGAIAAGPIHGAALGAVAVMAASFPALRPVVRLVPAALVALAGAYVASHQLRWGHETAFTWPRNFSRVHHLVVLGTVLLAVVAWLDDDRTVPQARREALDSDT